MKINPFSQRSSKIIELVTSTLATKVVMLFLVEYLAYAPVLQADTPGAVVG